MAQHAEWYERLLQRRTGRGGWPESAQLALSQIDVTRETLREAGFVKPLQGRTLAERSPPHWQCTTPMPNSLGLRDDGGIVLRTDEERAAYERELEEAREVQRTLDREYYRPAARAWDDLAPLVQAERRLGDE